MTTITIDRATVEQALEALELGYDTAKAEADRYHVAMAGFRPERHAQMDAEVQQIAAAIAALRAALAQQAEPVEPVATVTECEACFTPDVCQLRGTCDYYTASQMRIAALAREQAEPLTVERLRDALVASRIIPPAAVEDPDGYDDGVTLFRIEALHRRIT